MSKLRNGITTGTCAAAAAKAAALMILNGEMVETVQVSLPGGELIPVSIAWIQGGKDYYRAAVIKDGGDDPDVTHGLEIIAEVRLSGEGIRLSGGMGVGRVTMPGLQVPVGEAAINPVPRKMIMDAVSEVISYDTGLEVIIHVPQGKTIAKKTLNPKLGIIGGISILGTSGIVKPMSEEAFKNSLVPQIDIAIAHGHKTLLLTPGRIGERSTVERYHFCQQAVVQMSNFVGFILESCVDKGIEKIILWGHLSKLAKVAGGTFHTHNRVGDGRMEVIAAHAGLMGASKDVMQQIIDANTAHQAVDILKAHNLTEVFNRIALQASRRAEEYVFHQLEVGTVLIDMDGSILGLDNNALKLGGEMGWRPQ